MVVSFNFSIVSHPSAGILTFIRLRLFEVTHSRAAYFTVSECKSINSIRSGPLCFAAAIYRTNDRIHFASCFSVITPDATAIIVFTIASSGASIA